MQDEITNDNYRLFVDLFSKKKYISMARTNIYANM